MFLGIERGVVVQSAAHGFDNSAAADLLADHKGSYVGVALMPVNADMSELKKLDAQGFRGVRFNFVQHLGGGPALADVMRLSTKLASLGWHLQLHVESSMILKMTPELKLSPVPVVIDHMGRIDASRGLDQPGFTHLLKLLEDKRFWVKVSGLERASRQGAPYADAVPFARKLVSEFGERCIWGSDWPHPNLDRVPDDGVLVDLIGEFANEQQRQALLVDNPQKLYKFSA
jgi:2-pyrone-4,6-dicarboxylate lactonase